jgi:magnesium-transporting ATPase (P-type)
MKKELLILLQFVLATVLAGFGYFGLLLLVHGTTFLSLWDDYEPFLTRWILSFVVLSFIRFAFYYLIFRNEAPDSVQPNRKHSIGKEISLTIQYLIFAIVSIPVSFYLFLFSFPSHISVNMFVMWANFREGFLGWIIGFLMLSLLRLVIVYLKNKSLEEQID